MTGTKSQLGRPVQLTMLFAVPGWCFSLLCLFLHQGRRLVRWAAAQQAQLLSSLKQAAAIPGMKRFLLARMAFTDGLVTLLPLAAFVQQKSLPSARQKF